MRARIPRMRCITAAKSTRMSAGIVRAILVGIAHLGVQARSADDRFRRHAADIEAVAAEQMALDQRDLRALCRRGVRRDQSRRAGADDHEVVACRRLSDCANRRDARCPCARARRDRCASVAAMSLRCCIVGIRSRQSRYSQPPRESGAPQSGDDVGTLRISRQINCVR